jgi:hypothetical protein
VYGDSSQKEPWASFMSPDTALTRLKLRNDKTIFSFEKHR